ncbi:Slp1p KNAG_0C00760 [Huiozyma naganishii CBS 8797]|uniref:SUN-like protein 1 n=1 Tax=Huiozyma naganishii (strain ATCC MYA-139 / BCRC 22969 / CBS 8797 / KCTC 17520 / NBRC 10181 / NCYC 3082 / Yp74L-3) TaxID=1071383 RepID=J7S4A7_HUIN7|nr:hypothetical protein KNAG_0C00760 [Kazachstania naganishii CBS 8797]CCK69189.1 hypothetical protein KNAG_0C00760 [Kazachstania naganishii CBS 8797]
MVARSRLLFFSILEWTHFSAAASVSVLDDAVNITSHATSVSANHSTGGTSRVDGGNVTMHNLTEKIPVNASADPLPKLGEVKSEDVSVNSTETFLSFNEWKQLKERDFEMHEKLENIKNRRKIDPSCLRDGECIGEEMEIDIDVFKSGDDGTELADEPEGKLYKDKFNFASLDCAATMVKTNSEASGATSILIENKDKYLLNPCSAAKKFVVIELCEDILVEELVMANFEYFSSTFKRFRVSVSSRFPAPKNGWNVLGEFEGENTRDLQRFEIANPQIWAKYVRIEYLTHYDHEYYCPLSLVRVHGKTMMDEFKLAAREEIQQGKALVDAEAEHESAAADTEENRDTVARTTDSDELERPKPLDFKSSPKNHKYIMESELLNDSWGLPQFAIFDNITSPDPPISDPLRFCEARLEPLRFDEFLKEINFAFNSTRREGENDTICANNTGSLDNSTAIKNITGAAANGTLVNKTAPLNIPPQLPEESIFKNIMKRINKLEVNATLTVLYLEEQSKMLSNSFNELERTYLVRFDHLVNAFNDTIMNNIGALQDFAEELREQSLSLLDGQGKLAPSSSEGRLVMLEREVRVQKRLLYFCLCLLAYSLYHEYLNSFLFEDDDVEDLEGEVGSTNKY